MQCLSYIGCLFFDLGPGAGKKSGLCSQTTTLLPVLGGAVSLYWERSGWESGIQSPLWLSCLSLVLHLSLMPVLSLVPRCCTCTVTLAQCPSVVSVQWAGTAATASSTSRRRCRTPGPSPSSCWPTPSRAARQSRSVLPHPSPISLVLPCTESLPAPFQMACVDYQADTSVGGGGGGDMEKWPK